MPSFVRPAVVALALGVSLAASGAAAFEPPARTSKIKIEKGVRLANAGTPGLHVAGRKDLRIYYNSPDLGFATAESRNGRRWKNAQRIFGLDVPDSIVADASLIVLDGVLRLYFKVVPLDDQDSHQVWRATATDDTGANFVNDGLVFKRVGSPCFDWTSVPHAVITHEGRIRLYFVCSMGQAQVASAISDDGLDFSFEGVVLPDAVDPYVITEGDGYRIFFARDTGGSGNRTFNAIYSAVSDDGLEWTGIEMLAHASDFGAQAAIDPAAYEYRDGRYRVYVPTSLNLQGGVSDIYSLRYTPSDFMGRVR